MDKLQRAIAADHLERFKRCQKQLNTVPAARIRQWLSRLPVLEQALCRIVLNNLREQRRAKRAGLQLSEVQPQVADAELCAAHQQHIQQQLNQQP